MKKILVLLSLLFLFVSNDVSAAYMRNESINNKIDVYSQYIRKGKSIGDLVTFLNANSSTTYSLLFSQEVCSLTANVTIPSNVVAIYGERGGGVTGNYTLTFTGQELILEQVRFFGDDISVSGNRTYVVEPIHFGAGGEGLTDDTAATQRAINALLDGHAIDFGDGSKTYLIDVDNRTNSGYGDLTTSPTLLFEGLNNITVRGDGAKILQTESSKTSVSFVFGGCTNVKLEGLVFDGEFDFTGVDPYNYNQFGVIFDNCKQVDIRSNVFKNLSNYGLGISNDYDSTPERIATNNVAIIEGNIFENYGQNSTFGGYSQLKIIDNTFIDPHLAIFKMSSRGTVSGIENSFTDVIVAGNELFFRDSYQEHSDATVTSVIGWDCVSNVKNYKIHSNILNFKNNPLVSQGVKIEWASTPAVVSANLNNKNVQISDNQFLNMDVANSIGIEANNTIGNLLIDNNIFNSGDDGISFGVIALQNDKSGKNSYRISSNSFIDLTGADINITNSDIDYIAVYGNESFLLNETAANQFVNFDTTATVNILSIKDNTTNKPLALKGAYSRITVKGNDIEIIPTDSATIDAISLNRASTIDNTQVNIDHNYVRYGKNGIYLNYADVASIRNNTFQDMTVGYRIVTHNILRNYTNTFIDCTTDYQFDVRTSDSFGYEISKLTDNPIDTVTPNFQGETFVDTEGGSTNGLYQAIGLGKSNWSRLSLHYYRSNAGTPVSVLTPNFLSELVRDTSGNDWYISTGSSNTDWKKITP